MRTQKRCPLCKEHKEVFRFVDSIEGIRRQVCNRCCGSATLLPRDHPAFIAAAKSCQHVSQVRPVGQLTAPDVTPTMQLFLRPSK